MIKFPNATLKGGMTLSTPPPRQLSRYLIGIVAFFISVNLLILPFVSRKVNIQHKFPKESQLDEARRNVVKKEFLHAWSGYQDHGWMADGLKPLSGGHKTQFCSWSATLVDSLDTLWIMGLREEFDQAVNATVTIDFKHNAETCTVSLFESTIRYLGGLLAAYDLSGEQKLLPKLVEVGDMLYSAFNTSNGMPCSFCHLASKKEGEIFEASNNVAMADVGSLYLEFARLSQVTGDQKYVEAVTFVAGVFARFQNTSSVPGLWPEMINPSSITNINTTGYNFEPTFSKASFVYSLGALSDSSYEYLVKAHMLLGGVTKVYKHMWLEAADQIRKYLLFRAFIPGTEDKDILFTGSASRFDNSEEVYLDPRTQHLACFAGGLFAVASRVFNEPMDFEIGQALTEGCVWAYTHSPSGIMPESFSLLPCPELDGYGQCIWDEALWNRSIGREACIGNNTYCPEPLPFGYYQVSAPMYLLRPEAIESVFIMWRMTGNTYWRDVGWQMFQSIIKHTRTPFGHSALTSVMKLQEADRFEGGVRVKKMLAMQQDDMESFWFAETLKYFYLLFSETDLIDLDEYVLNTEAHPLRLTKGIRGF